VPGGFGYRGVPGKLSAIRYARENNVPFLGICYGMQLVVIDGLSQILPGVTSSEFEKDHVKSTEMHRVIIKMDEWMQHNSIVKAKNTIGGSMRLGNYECILEKGTLAHKIYGKDVVYERHRHRYEVNNDYLSYFQRAGLICSGRCGDLVEIIEKPDMKFFVAVQFHPEFQSTCVEPHPLFKAFLSTCFRRNM
jgi:CTP synthase